MVRWPASARTLRVECLDAIGAASFAWALEKAAPPERKARGYSGLVLGLELRGWLGEGNEVPSRILDGEFAHAVEGGALEHDFLHVLHGG
jgi:hypothetical protein